MKNEKQKTKNFFQNEKKNYFADLGEKKFFFFGQNSILFSFFRPGKSEKKRTFLKIQQSQKKTSQTKFFPGHGQQNN